MKVLYLDIEGGFGGSSRSLFALIEALRDTGIEREVWCASNGPMLERCKEIGVVARVEPGIVSFVPRPNRNVRLAVTKIFSALRFNSLIDAIGASRPDILHLNYDGLFLIAMAVRRRFPDISIVLHCRTFLHDHILTRWMLRSIEKSVDHVIWISENERDRARSLGFPQLRPSTVIYNTAGSASFASESERVPSHELRVSFFGTVDHLRGADRLIEVALELRKHDANVRIRAFGRSPRYKKFFVLSRRDQETLAAKVEKMELGRWLIFEGFTQNPNMELLVTDVVLRPSRGNDPWGRDVIEALIAGVPVIATGSYDRFVRPDQTGFLLPSWSAEECCACLIDLSIDRVKLESLSKAARLHARALFNPLHARDAVMDVYRGLIA